MVRTHVAESAVASAASFCMTVKGIIMLEVMRARSANKKATKLIGNERYSEAAFVFENARKLYRSVGDYEKAAVAHIAARAAMKLAKKKSQSSPHSPPPSSEIQARIIDRWTEQLHYMTVDQVDSMTLTVADEKKLAQKA